MEGARAAVSRQRGVGERRGESGVQLDHRNRLPLKIAATFASVGVTPKFHEGAADLYRLLDTTPFAKETRETLDRSRTLEQAVKVYAEHLKKPKKAAAA